MPTSRSTRISWWPSRASSARAALRVSPRREQPAARLLVTEEDVLGDGEPGDEVELLVDRGDAERDRGVGGAQRDRLAAPADLALVGPVRAGQHLDQGGLAGAVLAEQAVHLAGPDDQVDAVERADAGEGLDDPAHLQQRLVVGGRGVARPVSVVAHWTAVTAVTEVAGT